EVPGVFVELDHNGLNYRKNWENLDNVLYVVDDKDDNGERTLGKIRLFDLVDSCYSGGGGEEGIVGYIQVLATEFRLWTNVRPIANAAREASIDGGVTWKSALGANAHLIWTNSELEALGVDREVPSVTIRKISNGCTIVV